MPSYDVSFQSGNLTTSYKTGLAVAAAAAAASGIQIRRGKILEIEIGAAGPPNATDTSIQWDASDFAAFATTWVFGTTPGINPDDGADSAFNGQVGSAASTEGTYSGRGGLWGFFLNQRAAYCWKATDETRALIYPATANHGIGLRALTVTSGYASPVGGKAKVLE